MVGKESPMLSDANVLPMLPVKDFEGAKRFYEKTLALRKVDEMPGTAVTYRSGNSTLCVYRSDHAGTNQGTAALWEVPDVDATVKELKAKGVSFEKYDMPGISHEGDVHRAGDLRVAWFKDPDGNILSVQNRPAKTNRGQGG
jgi:catechol 2,3-dioxygenase-like lactoylglutathione lyase family enzyme